MWEHPLQITQQQCMKTHVFTSLDTRIDIDKNDLVGIHSPAENRRCNNRTQFENWSAECEVGTCRCTDSQLVATVNFEGNKWSD